MTGPNYLDQAEAILKDLKDRNTRANRTAAERTAQNQMLTDVIVLLNKQSAVAAHLASTTPSQSAVAPVDLLKRVFIVSVPTSPPKTQPCEIKGIFATEDAAHAYKTQLENDYENIFDVINVFPRDLHGGGIKLDASAEKKPMKPYSDMGVKGWLPRNEATNTKQAAIEFSGYETTNKKRAANELSDYEATNTKHGESELFVTPGHEATNTNPVARKNHSPAKKAKLSTMDSTSGKITSKQKFPASKTSTIVNKKKTREYRIALPDENSTPPSNGITTMDQPASTQTPLAADTSNPASMETTKAYQTPSLAAKNTKPASNGNTKAELTSSDDPLAITKPELAEIAQQLLRKKRGYKVFNDRYMALTGVFPHIGSIMDVEHMVIRYGGKLAFVVNERTDIIVVGGGMVFGDLSGASPGTLNWNEEIFIRYIADCEKSCSTMGFAEDDLDS
jgi:hypothetical protein